MKFKDLFKTIFRSDIEIKRIKRVYDKNGVLREETVESNVAVDLGKVDSYFKKMDDVFKKMDEVFKDL